ALAMGWAHTCALMDVAHSSGVKCWGYNGQGQLGDGTIQPRNTPVDVSGLGSGVTALAAGGSHTCALVGSGRPKCWGWDKYGQLGLGTIAQSLTPIDIIDNIPVQVAINYPTGLPGSYFTITGENFPVSSTLTVTVNSVVLTTTLHVNETGGFIFFVNTMGADTGSYTLTAGGTSGLKGNIALAAVSNASVSFTLLPAAPLRIQEGGGSTISIPAGLAQPLTYLYLPLLQK
ncbi:MAG: hypothetical protein HY870_17005, partial [Chloroflexi bacterium]|nr:hypothetical protein [Chloroflexota bacterium]